MKTIIRYAIYSNKYGELRKETYKTFGEAHNSIIDSKGDAEEEIFEIEINL